MKSQYKATIMAAGSYLLCAALAGCSDSQSATDPCSTAGRAYNPGACEGQVPGPSADCPVGFVKNNGQCVANTRECPAGEHPEGNQCVPDELTVDIISRSACKMPSRGTTQLIMQFIARDELGRALDPGLNEQNQPTLTTSEIFVGGKPVDVESTINRDSELLKSNLMLSLVLDASYSMLTHNPPAFEPMKEAAIEILQTTDETWQANDSSFDWRLVWFNDFIYEPAPNMAGEPWDIADIAYLPAPEPGTLTALYKAVDHMAGVHQGLYEDGIAAEDRDQHIMVILSDGEDNASRLLDNSDHSETGNLNGVINWREFGAPITTQADLTVAFAAVPNLRVHVIGLGDKVNSDELQTIAKAGNGQYFEGSDTAALNELFDSVRQEFVTLQTVGVVVPLEAGTHQVSLLARHEASGAEGGSSFSLTVDDSLPECSD